MVLLNMRAAQLLVAIADRLIHTTPTLGQGTPLPQLVQDALQRIEATVAAMKAWA